MNHFEPRIRLRPRLNELNRRRWVYRGCGAFVGLPVCGRLLRFSRPKSQPPRILRIDRASLQLNGLAGAAQPTNVVLDDLPQEYAPTRRVECPCVSLRQMPPRAALTQEQPSDHPPSVWLTQLGIGINNPSILAVLKRPVSPSTFLVLRLDLFRCLLVSRLLVGFCCLTEERGDCLVISASQRLDVLVMPGLVVREIGHQIIHRFADSPAILGPIIPQIDIRPGQGRRVEVEVPDRWCLPWPSRPAVTMMICCSCLGLNSANGFMRQRSLRRFFETEIPCKPATAANRTQCSVK